MNQTNNPCKQLKCIQREMVITGRFFKVFCGINCKNNYHKTQRAYKKDNIQHIEDILHKNYFIREGLLESKSMPIRNRFFNLV